MGIVSRIQKGGGIGRPRALTSADLASAISAGGGTSTGVSVTTDSAMKLITVQNCVRVRAYTIGQLPCHLIQQTDRERTYAKDHFLYELLHDQPNPYMTSAEFWSMAEAYICLRGNFVAQKITRRGQVVELIPINYDNIQEINQLGDYSLEYKILSPSGIQKILKSKDVLHLRGLTLNGYTGVNPIEYARETIGLGIAGVQFLGKYFGKGMHPGAVLKHPARLSPDALRNMRKAYRERYATLSNTHDFMLIDDGMDIAFPDIKLVDAQFLEQAKFNEAQICGLFRVPQMLIQSGDKSPTYASAEQFMLQFMQYGITPDIVAYEKAIRKDLIPEADRVDHYAKFQTAALLRSSFKEQMESFAVAIDKEVFSPNECREMLDRNPYEGGDEYRTRTSTVKQEGAAKEPVSDES